MAITRGTIGVDQTTDAAGEELAFDTGAGDTPCTTLMVRCRSGSSNPATVRIEGLHKGIAVDGGVAVAVGEREYFRLGERNGIRKVFIGGTGGAVNVDWGPVAAINIQV